MCAASTCPLRIENVASASLEVCGLTLPQFNSGTHAPGDGVAATAAPTHLQNFTIGVLVRRCFLLLRSRHAMLIFLFFAPALEAWWKAL
jgi:hypothetical protein